MVDVPLILLSAAAIFAAALVQGVTGFGFVIVAAPVLTIYLEPTLVVPVMLLVSVFLNAAIMAHGYRWMNLRRVWALIIAGAAFTPVGAALLIGLDAAIIRVLVGVVVGATAIAMLFGLRRSASRELLVSVPVGAVSGVLGGAAGLSGAPVVLFFTNQSVDPRESRANIVFYFQVLNVVALPSFAVGGILTREVFTLALEVLPGAVAGVAGGIWLSSRISVALFSRISLVIVMLAGVGAIASGIA
jgi:uncharacterized membrane protein YfcA